MKKIFTILTLLTLLVCGVQAQVLKWDFSGLTNTGSEDLSAIGVSSFPGAGGKDDVLKDGTGQSYSFYTKWNNNTDNYKTKYPNMSFGSDNTSRLQEANGWLRVGSTGNGPDLTATLTELAANGNYTLSFYYHAFDDEKNGKDIDSKYRINLGKGTCPLKDATNKEIKLTKDAVDWVDIPLVADADGNITFTFTSTRCYLKYVYVRENINILTQTISVDLNTSDTRISVDATDQSGATVTGRSYTFTSSDENVATVDANGYITGVSSGQATITVNFAGDEQYAPSTGTLTVVVADPNQYHYVIRGADINDDGTYAAIEYQITQAGNLPAHETVDVGSLITIEYSSGNWTIQNLERYGNNPTANGANPTCDAGAIPTDGCYIMFTPKVYGKLSVDMYYYATHYYRLVGQGKDKNGKVDYSYNQTVRESSAAGKYNDFPGILKPGVTYYLYCEGNHGNLNYNLDFRGFQFTPTFVYSAGDTEATTEVTAYYNLKNFNSFPNVLLDNKAVSDVNLGFTSSNTSLATVNSATGVVTLPTVTTDEDDKTSTITASATCETKEVGASGVESNKSTCTVKTSYQINASYNETAYRVTESGMKFEDVYAYEIGTKTTTYNKVNVTRQFGDVLLTWGGCDWSASDGSYTQHNTGRGTASVKDSYQDSKADENGAIDGFAYFFYGKNNPKDERAYNWGFGPTSKTDDTETSFNNYLWGGIRFNIPCRGTYFRFEPTANGELTVYMQQNGSINKDDNNKSIINNGTFSYRPIYILDETGNPVKLKAAETSARVYFDASDMPNSDAITNAQEKAYYYPAIYPYWSAKEGGEYTHGKDSPCKFLRITDPKQLPSATNQASEVTIQSGVTEASDLFILSGGMVKYKFPVQAGKTYFVFAQRTKLGLSGFLLDKSAEAEKGATNIEETATSMPAAGTYESITLNGREFKSGRWAAICLPFSVSESQVKNIFGNDAVVAYYTNTENGHMTMGRHAYNMILAGTPCLLKPSKDVTSPKFEHVTIESNIHVGVNNDWVANGATTETEYSRADEATGNYSWVGTYGQGTPIQPGDYFISGGNLWKNDGTTAKTLKSCRAYLSRTNTSAPDLNGESFEDLIEGETTAIEGIMIADDADNANIPATRQGVYNLNGQYLGTSTEHLGKGIYIVNGSKTIIK